MKRDQTPTSHNLTEAIKYYNAIAPSYEVLYRTEQTEKIKKAIELAKPVKGESILDVGAGTGIAEELLTGFSITALEPSEMSENIRHKGLNGIKIVKRDLFAFVPKEKFDLTLCITVLQDIERVRLPEAIKRVFSFCKERGRAVVSVLKASKIDLSEFHPVTMVDVANDVMYLFSFDQN